MALCDVKPEYLPYYEQIADDIIICSIDNYYQVGYDALRNIFNASAEFYKKADHDTAMRFPLGRDRPLTSYRPAVGE